MIVVEDFLSLTNASPMPGDKLSLVIELNPLCKDFAGEFCRSIANRNRVCVFLERHHRQGIAFDIHDSITL
jgi:hypothetical protein